MKILAIEHELPGASAEAFKPYMKAEAMRAWELHQAAVVRELYFRQDKNEAVLVMEAPTVGEAKDALDTLPLVKAGLITFELIPLKAYPGFARLFVPQ
jgi:hypothetical protein